MSRVEKITTKAMESFIEYQKECDERHEKQEQKKYERDLEIEERRWKEDREHEEKRARESREHELRMIQILAQHQHQLPHPCTYAYQNVDFVNDDTY